METTTPHDLVDYADPSYTTEPTLLPGFRCSCGYVGLARDKEQHLWLAHPAYRNAEIGCQATPLWDHERWCLRPKGHDGKHWTPGLAGGREW